MEDYKKDDKKDYDPELVVDATIAVDNGPPIPPNHSRFYCENCRVVRYWSLLSFLWIGCAYTAWLLWKERLWLFYALATHVSVCITILTLFVFVYPSAIRFATRSYELEMCQLFHFQFYRSSSVPLLRSLVNCEFLWNLSVQIRMGQFYEWKRYRSQTYSLNHIRVMEVLLWKRNGAGNFLSQIVAK